MGRPFPGAWEGKRSTHSPLYLLCTRKRSTHALCTSHAPGKGLPMPSLPGAWEVQRAWVDLFLVHGRYRGRG